MCLEFIICYDNVNVYAKNKEFRLGNEIIIK